ncbi:MAG: fibronectin type III domain-containing protein, partial [Thermoplasmata archaeon]
SRYIQYEVNFTRIAGPELPRVDEVRLKYHRYARNGTVETEDFIPGNAMSWGLFNSSNIVPVNTSITYWCSSDSGGTWTEIQPGDNLSVLPVPKIRFRVNLSTKDTSISPVLHHINLTFTKDDLIPSVIVNTVNYGPFNSDPGSIINVDFDGLGGADLDCAEWDTDPGFGSPATIFSLNVPLYSTDWSVNWSGLAEGWNTIHIRCYDLVGNVNDTETVFILKDTVIPEAVSNFTACGNTSTSIVLTWDAQSEGGSGFMNYTIYYSTSPDVDWNAQVWSHLEQGNLTSNTTCYAEVLGLSQNTTYYFKIIVFDNANNNGSLAEAQEISVKTNGHPHIVGLDILGHSDGEPIYAGLTYVWQVEIYDPDHVADLDYVELILDPSGIGMKLTWTESNDTFWKSWDPCSYISLVNPDAGGNANNIILGFEFSIGWEFEYEILYEPSITIRDKEGSIDSATFYAETWRGENDLEFQGTLSVTGAWQGTLTDGDWVKGGETIRLEGLSVVFEGTNISPSDSDFDIAVSDDDGDMWTDTQGSLDMDIVADSTHDDEDIHNIVIINVTSSSSVPNIMFTVKVDCCVPLVEVNAPIYGPFKSDPQDIIDVDFHCGMGMNSTLDTAEYRIGAAGQWNSIFQQDADYYSANWHVDWDGLSSGWNIIHIRCYDLVGNVNNTQSVAIFKGNLPPDAPFLIAPANNTVQISCQPVLSWVETPDPNGDEIQLYMLQWSISENFSLDVENKIIAENSYEPVPPLLDKRSYFWRVKAFDGENWGDYSEIFTFSIDVYYYHPRITGMIPDQVKPEDFGFWSLDLSGYADDFDTPQSQLRWYVTGRNASLFLIFDENTTNLTFITKDNVFGCDEVILWVEDAEGHTDSRPLWINITPVNDMPGIESIDPLIIHYDAPYTYHFFNYVSDLETPKDRLTLTTDEPQYTAVDGLKVTFTYPKSMLGQSDTVIVTVWDEDGDSAATVVIIKITSDWVPELVAELPDMALHEGESLTDVFNLDDYFMDPDEDSLYYVTGNSHVNIFIKGNHSVDVSAPLNWHGIEYVSFIALDPLKARVEDIVMITVIPVNDPPVIEDVPDLVVHYNVPYIFDLTPYISDPDTKPGELTLSTQTGNISFSDMKMTVTFPEDQYGAMIPVIITVSDGIDEDFDTIVITVSDDHPPIALVENLPHVWFYEDSSYTTAWSLHSYFMDSDPEDTLFYINTTGGFDILIDQALGTIYFSPPTNWWGTLSTNIRAIDPHGAIAETPMLVSVMPVNDPPTIGPIPDQRYGTGQSWVLDLRDYVKDIDNDDINFTDLEVRVISRYPESVSPVGHFIIFEYPLGVKHDEVTITVSDGINETSQSFFVVLSSEPEKSFLSQISWIWWLLPLIAALVLGLIFAYRRSPKEEAVVIEDMFLVDKNGILIKHATRRLRPNIDNDMLAGMLTAVQMFIEDTFKYSDDTTALKSLEFGNKALMIERGMYSYLAIIHSGELSEPAKDSIREWLNDFEKRNAASLENWNGDATRFDGLDEEFHRIFRSSINRSGRKGQKAPKSTVNSSKTSGHRIKNSVSTQSESQIPLLTLNMEEKILYDASDANLVETEDRGRSNTMGSQGSSRNLPEGEEG